MIFATEGTENTEVIDQYKKRVPVSIYPFEYHVEAISIDIPIAEIPPTPL